MQSMSNCVETLSVVLILTTSAHAQRLPPEIVVSNPTVYEVTITTKFVVPKNGQKLAGLGVWHALPNSRPWDGLDRTIGASAISFEPAQGRIQHLATNESQNVYWEMRDGLIPGKSFEFVSRFRVRSADRDYDVKRSTAKWSDYQRNLGESRRCRSKRHSTRSSTRSSVPSPRRSWLEFCKWVTANIKYDASVPYASNDLAATLAEKARTLWAPDDRVRGDVPEGRNPDPASRRTESQDTEWCWRVTRDSTGLRESAHLDADLLAGLGLG